MRDDEDALARLAHDQVTHEGVTPLADLDPRLPAPWPNPGLAPLEGAQQLAIARLDLAPREPGPAADIELAQTRIELRGEGRAARRPAEAVVRARDEIARDEPRKGPLRVLEDERRREGPGLFESLRGQVGIGVPLPTPARFQGVCPWRMRQRAVRVGGIAWPIYRRLTRG